MKHVDHETRMRQGQIVSVLLKPSIFITDDFTGYTEGKQDPSIFKVDISECSKKQGGGSCGTCQEQGLKANYVRKISKMHGYTVPL